MKLSKSSQTYEFINRWAKVADSDSLRLLRNGNGTTCTLIWLCFISFLYCILAAGMATVCLLAIALPIAEILAALVTGYWSMDGSGMTLAFLYLCIAAFVAIVYLIAELRDFIYVRLANAESSEVENNDTVTVRKLWQAFKDKTCVKIELED